MKKSKLKIASYVLSTIGKLSEDMYVSSGVDLPISFGGNAVIKLSMIDNALHFTFMPVEVGVKNM